jgi:cysteinyl-tRNA synthetase
MKDNADLPEYGELSNRKIEDQQAGARVAVEAHKKNPGDFVLWKESTGDLPGWPAHFHFNSSHIDIYGRPGWHIECSVMSEHHLGKTFDIHGGGLDLIFPHHENEIAQSCCAHGTKAMANYWMHNGFLQVEGQKMSKSLGNFVTISDNLSGNFLDWEGGPWHGTVLKTAMLMTQYRQPIDWTLERLLEARQKVSRWYLPVRLWIGEEWEHYQRNGFSNSGGVISDEVANFLCEDLDSPSAISELDKIAESALSNKKAQLDLIETLFRFGFLDKTSLRANPSITAGPLVKGKAIPYLEATSYGVAIANNNVELSAAYESQINKLGYSIRWIAPDQLDLSPLKSQNVVDVEGLVKTRLAALASKNFVEADRIRDELSAQGIQLMDYKDVETGERKTKWEVKR